MVGHEYDMEYLFESSTRYVMSERSKRVRYKVEHEERNSMFTSNHELLCLYLQYTLFIFTVYKQTDKIVFDNFLQISNFAKIFYDSPKIVHVSKIFPKFPKKYFRSISEYFRGRSIDVSIIHKFKHSLMVKQHITVTSENTVKYATRKWFCMYLQVVYFQ